MVRQYKKKSDRRNYNEEKVLTVLKHTFQGMAVAAAARSAGMNRTSALQKKTKMVRRFWK